MKGFIKLILIFIAIFNIETLTIPSGENPLFDHSLTKCSKDGAHHPPKLWQKFFEGQLPEQEFSEMADYAYCVFRKLGYIEDDGKLKKDAIIKKYHELFGPKNPEIKKYLKCLEIKNENLRTMSWELYRCNYDLRYKCQTDITNKVEKLEQSD